MRHLLTLMVLVILINIVTIIMSGCKTHNREMQALEHFASDSTDAYNPLKPNEEWLSNRHTYGKDSILGHIIKYRMTTDSNEIYVNYDFTVMEIHPKINANLLSFLHGVMLNWGFLNEKDSITPWTLCELVEEGLTQQEVVHKVFDWEKERFYEQLQEIYKWGERGYELDVKIYPVFMNEDFITFRKFAYYYTGGAHGNHTSFLQTYNLKTGETINLEDMIKEDKYNKVRSQVVKHMASSYPIYDDVTSMQQYLDTLNSWLSKTNLGVIMGVTKESDLDRINEKNYPLNDPGINETGLVITYEKYHLTPGADGVPVIVLTYDEIRDCLKPPFNNYKTILSKEESDTKEDSQCDKHGNWYSKEEKDSIRNSLGLADNGKPYPIDSYDQYEYRNGKLNKHYTQKDIKGTWYGYGHLYDDRKTLILNEDGSYELIREEALNQDENGEMIYDYYLTISGKYVYDTKQNKITLLNFEERNKILREDYIKYEHPEHKEFIIHEIKGEEMKLADELGDLWPYFKMK